MSSIKTKTADDISMNYIERDYIEALERLKKGIPREKSLQTILKQGKLKINFTTVALEAGHARSPIALGKTKYPRVRSAILAARSEKVSDPTTAGALVRVLREQVAALKSALRDAETEAQRHFHARCDAEEKLRIMKEDISRLRPGSSG